MFDIKTIRDNPTDFDAAMARRGLEAQSAKILEMDEQRRAVQTELQSLQAERNEKSKQIGEVKKSGGDADAVMQEVAAIKTRMGELEEKERESAQALNDHLSVLPNTMASDVPDGADEEDNVEIRKWGEPATTETPEHFDIGEALTHHGMPMMDFETAAKMSGSRFVFLSGGLARLERALAQLFLDIHTGEHGYTETMPPLLVRDNALYGTGQLPKFSEDLYKTELDDPEEKDKIYRDSLKSFVMENKGLGQEEFNAKLNVFDLSQRMLEVAGGYKRRNWLIPTAEVPLTNIVAGDIVDEETLPRRYTAFTPCFRQEAGAAGKDTRGYIRMHQFYKVEMVSIVYPDKSAEEHERMTECAENILKKLELPYRTMMLCSGDTGFGAQKTYDVEVWLPGQQRYREISSCSNCGDFQARRMNARCRPKGEKQTKFVHTLNGSGVAVGRALIAVMENYYDPSDGGIHVPEALKPYMGGLDKIVKT